MTRVGGEDLQRTAPDDLDRLLARSAPLGLVATDEHWTIIHANPAIEELTGHDPATIVGRSFAMLLTMAGRVLHQSNLAPRLLVDGHITEVAVDLVHADGGRIPALLASRLIDDRPIRIVTSLTSVSERHDHERELMAARRRAEHSERQTQRLHEITRSFADAHRPRDVEQLLATHLDELGGELVGFWVPERGRGDPRALDGSPMPCVDPQTSRRTLGRDGSVLGHVSIRFPEQTEPDDDLLRSLLAAAEQALARLSLLDQLRRQASTDELTGLSNRRYFDRVVASMLSERERRDHPVTLFYLDLDGFKSVNDRLGHAAGDRLLRAVADDLSRSLRSYDVLARLGGDEFAVVVRDLTSRQEVDAVATRLVGIVARQVGGREVGASVGAVHVPLGVEALDPDRLLHAADVAMYEAKRRAELAYVVHEVA